METAILVVGWIGLLGALLLTLVILKQVSLLLRTLSGILKLAQRIRDASRGIAANLQPVPTLANAAPPALALRDTVRALTRTSGSLELQLADLAGPTLATGD